MNIQTKFHGVVEVLENQILTFYQGILGFESETQFVLLEEGPFKVLQSLKNKEVAFVMADPWGYEPTYEFELNESAITALEIQSPEELVIYNILTIGFQAKHITMNLLAPIVIHKTNSYGMQIVLEGTSYTTKHPVGIEGCQKC